MRLILRTSLILLMTLASSGTTVRGDGFDPSEWVNLAPVEFSGRSGKPLAELALTPQVFDTARPTLDDMRVVADGTKELGYVVRKGATESRTVPVDVRLYNRSYLPGSQSSVTVDFGSKVLKNRITVVTPGTNFRRKVRVEAGDDGEAWRTVRDGAFLFRVQETAARGPAFDKKVVEIPGNDQRYLRLTVFAGADDPDAITIEDVTAARTVRTEAETLSVPIAHWKVDEKKRATEMVLDLGYRNMPLYRVELQCADRTFFRHVTVEGRNEEKRVIRTVVEDSPALERTIDVPWQHIATGTVYRFSTREGTDESLRLALSGAQFRYLRIRIGNHDDPPLQFTGANVDRLVTTVAFSVREGASYALYLGNPRAEKPTYDLSHFANRLRTEGVDRATLGPVTANPLHKPKEKVIPWSERHQGIIWVALLVMACGLGFLVYRMARDAKASQTGS